MDPIFRSIAESTPESIMLLDRDARIEFINRTAPGLTIEQVIGTQVYDYVPPEQHTAMRECFERVAATARPDSYQNIYTTAEGQILLWESRVGAVQREGQVSGFVVISADVTEQRTAALDRARIFELSLDMLAVAGFDGRFKQVSPAFTKTLHYTEEELLARPFMDFVHPDDHQRTVAAMEELAEGRNVTNFDNRYRRKDGVYRTLQWQASVDESTGRIIAIGRDVTDARALQEQLLQSQKMDAIGQLAGGVAHDFNNLMLSVIANAEFAAEAAVGNPELLEYIGEIDRAAERAAELTRRLLSVARRQPVHAALVDLNGLTRQMMKLLHRLIPENIELVLKAGEGLAPVSGDAAQIEQVILNLCLNARDATEGAGRIVLETDGVTIDPAYREANPWAREGAFVQLTVTDTGVGMSPGVRDRVFEPFFTTKGPGKGTGLGLATVYGVVKQHDGLINIQSREGEGTSVRVFFPAASPAAVSPGAPPVAVERGGAGTVLVAEDEETVRKVVIKKLRQAGYRVLAAADGLEAVSVFRDHADEVSMALLDVVMPGQSGPEAYRQMDELRPGLPVLFSSGYADEARFPGKLPEGARVLAKPYRSEDLLRRVRECLERSEG